MIKTNNNYGKLRSLGFRPTRGSKSMLSIDLCVKDNDFITIQIELTNDSWHFTSIEIDTAEGSKFVRENFKTFSNKEILDYLENN